MSLEIVAAKIRGRTIINPETSVALARWDLIGFVFLVLMAFLTPFEAGFLLCAEAFSPRFVLNKVMTLFFFCDLVLQFFLPYVVPTRFGHRLVYQEGAIIKHYLRNWFVIDFASVIPLDLIFPCNRSGGLGFNLDIVRAIRLLRLLKMLRLLRSIRIFRRWQAEFGFSLRKTMLYQLMAVATVAAHWAACILGLLERLQPDGGVNWMSEARASLQMDQAPQTFWDSYLIAVHTSMTLLIHPHSYKPTGSGELVAFSCLLLLGGFIWTQVISRTTAICTSLNQHQNSYQTTMDDLNQISGDFDLSQDMRRRLRKYFMNTQDESKREAWGAIVKKMSPKLRRDCCREVNKYWVLSIRFLRKVSNDLITDVAERMRVECFSETEYFGEPFTLYIQMEGTAMLARTGKVVAPGIVWGEDHLLLSCRELQLDNTATAMVFVQCEALTKAAMDEVILDHPEQKEHFRRETIRLAVIRGIMWQAHCRKEAIRMSLSQVAHGSPLLAEVSSAEALIDKPRPAAPSRPSPAEEAHVTAKPTTAEDVKEFKGFPPKPKKADEPLRDAALREQVPSDFSTQAAAASPPARIGDAKGVYAAAPAVAKGRARGSALANGIEGAGIVRASGGSGSLVEELAIRVEQLADQQSVLMEHIMLLAVEVRSLAVSENHTARTESESHTARTESINLTAGTESDFRKALRGPIIAEPGGPASV